MMDGNKTINETAAVQNNGAEEIIQPYNNNNKSDCGIRLLRILSNIFHLDNKDIGFDKIFLLGPGTHGNIQLAICQSPLIHRCLRCISVIYLAGYSS